MPYPEHLNADKPFAGAAVYIWHRDRAGQCSMDSPAAQNENYLRGIQAADRSGTVRFASIFPACYRAAGRTSTSRSVRASATSSKNKIATSQIALTKDACDAVYETSGYEQSLTNISSLSLASDNIFSDGYDVQIPQLTGSPSSGLSADVLARSGRARGRFRVELTAIGMDREKVRAAQAG